MTHGPSIVVRFASLPASVQQRFLAYVATPAETMAGPIAAESVARWRACAGVSLLGLLGAAMATIVLGGMFHATSQTMFIFVVLAVPAVLLLGYAVSVIVRRNPFVALPYAPGRYLFPFDFIDARGPTLVVQPLEAGAFECVHHHVNGGYVSSTFVVHLADGTKSSFRFTDRSVVDWRLAKMQSLRDTAARAAASGDLATLAQIDPLSEVRASGGWDRFRS